MSTSVQERHELGRARRAALPRSRLGRLRPRRGRMLASPFAFYRGGALIMASDLGTGPQTGLTVQLCGAAAPTTS